MGLKMPAYAYFSAKGASGVRFEEGSKYNRDSQEALDRFFNLLRHPIVREIGIRSQAAYNNEIDLCEIDWRSETIFETDLEYRPRLAQLIEAMDKRGTLVIPDLNHLRDGNTYCLRLIDRFCESAIAPVSVADLKNRIDRLEGDLRRPLPKLRRSQRVEEDVGHFFLEMTTSAVHNRDQLKNSHVHRAPA